MGDTTDDLLAMAKQVSANPDRRELDMLLSAGERISMALLSMAIRELGGDAISFTGSQSGIITNDRHVDARIIEVRPFRVHDELARGRIVVIAGYQGVSYQKEVTTLGRGGSDTTAVAMAAALDAEYCEICSDVDGVYSADPRVVPAARRIGTLSYEETQEMAEAGAKVLNAQAVEFAKDKGIAIYARATRVRCLAPIRQPTARSCASTRRACPAPSSAWRASATSSCSRPTASRRRPARAARRARRRRQAAPRLRRPDDARDLAREPARRSAGCASALQARLGGRARLVDGLAAVSVVGAGINASYANVRARQRRARGRRHRRAGTATSSFRITWMVPRERDAGRRAPRCITVHRSRPTSGPAGRRLTADKTMHRDTATEADCDTSLASHVRPAALPARSPAAYRAEPSRASDATPDVEAFLKEANETLLRLSNEANQAGWVQQTYITPDTEAMSARADQAFMTRRHRLREEGRTPRRLESVSRRHSAS